MLGSLAETQLEEAPPLSEVATDTYLRSACIWQHIPAHLILEA